MEKSFQFSTIGNLNKSFDKIKYQFLKNKIGEFFLAW